MCRYGVIRKASQPRIQAPISTASADSSGHLRLVSTHLLRELGWKGQATMPYENRQPPLHFVRLKYVGF